MKPEGSGYATALEQLQEERTALNGRLADIDTAIATIGRLAGVGVGGGGGREARTQKGRARREAGCDAQAEAGVLQLAGAGA